MKSNDLSLPVRWVPLLKYYKIFFVPGAAHRVFGNEGYQMKANDLYLFGRRLLWHRVPFVSMPSGIIEGWVVLPLPPSGGGGRDCALPHLQPSIHLVEPWPSIT